LETESIGSLRHGGIHDPEEFEEVFPCCRSVPHKPILFLNRERLPVEIPVLVSTDIRGPCHTVLVDGDNRTIGESQGERLKLWSKHVVNASACATWESNVIGCQSRVIEGVHCVTELLVGDETSAIGVGLNS